MVDYVSPSGVADVYVEYHGEEVVENNSSRSDFEDEDWELSNDEEPDVVLTVVEPAESDTDVLLFTDRHGAVKEVVSRPLKKNKNVTMHVVVDVDEEDYIINQAPVSQVDDLTHVFSSSNHPSSNDS
jgi:hypothetical protein